MNATVALVLLTTALVSCGTPEEPAAPQKSEWIIHSHVAFLEADAKTVVITGDILLADRCLKAGATVIAPNGKPFTAASIGGAIATRAIMADLRAGGDAIGGPPPFAKADRSRFLQALDSALVRLARH